MNERRYRLLLLAVFLVGIGLASVKVECPADLVRFGFICGFLSEIPRKIGEALIIAPVLALLVDEAAKTKILREFSLDVSSHIIGRMLPFKLRDHLTGYLQMFLVRTRWDITYHIEKWDGQPGYIRLKTISEYDMENYSNNPTDYDFKYAVEESQHPHIGCTQITSIRLGEETYDDTALADSVKTDNNFQIFASKKQLLPHNGPGKPTYTFRAESIECFRDSDFSPFFTFYPVMSAVLRVWYPETLSISLELTFDDITTGTVPIDMTSGNLKGKQWTIRGPILPGQGFVVRWDAIAAQVPRNTTNTAVAPTQT